MVSGGASCCLPQCKRLAAAGGAAAIQLEDASDMEDSTLILPREDFLAKVRAALEALEGTDCMLIARSNADPTDPEMMKEGCERLAEAQELGAELAMLVKVTTYEQAVEMAKIVTGGPKIFADVRAEDGTAAVTMGQLTPLNFVMCSTHFTLKAAMEGMLVHGRENFKNQDVAYTFTQAEATGQVGFSATPMFDPPKAIWNWKTNLPKRIRRIQSWGNKVEDYPPEGFCRPKIKDRF